MGFAMWEAAIYGGLECLQRAKGGWQVGCWRSVGIGGLAPEFEAFLFSAVFGSPPIRISTWRSFHNFDQR